MKMENVSKIKCIPFLLKYHVLVFIDSDYIYSLKHLTVNAIRLYFHKLYFQQIFSVIKSRIMPPVFPNDEAIASNLIDLVGLAWMRFYLVETLEIVEAPVTSALKQNPGRCVR